MEVNQIGIKINQTPISNEGISRINTKSKTSMINFDQILSMFSLLGQSAELNGKEEMPSLQKVSNEMVGESENHSFDAEDWKKLDSILTLLLAGIQQQPQYSSSSLNLLSENSLPTDSSLSSQNSGNMLVGSQKDLNTYDWQKIESALTNILAGSQQNQGLGNSTFQDFQNAAGISSETPYLVNPNQKNDSSNANVPDSLPQDTNQLLVKLEQIIEKIHDNNMLSTHSEFDEITGMNKKPSMNNPPNEIIDKIQLILQTIKPENKPVDSTLLNSQLTNNRLLFDINIEKQGKNPLENKLGKTPILSFKEDTSLPDNNMSYSGHPVQKTNEFNQTNSSLDSAPLQVTDFVPEVSEWIGRFMGNSNGQFKSAEAKFSLYPEHLGHIEIKITTQQGQISAQIMTDTPTAKEALEGQLQHLRQALQQHGIVVQKLDIVQQPSVEFNPSSFSFSQGGSGSQDQRAFLLGRETGKKQKGHDSTDAEIEALSTSYGGIQKSTSTIDFTA